VIAAAAGGSAEGRDEFARRYDRVIRAYLGARWRASPLHAEIDDALQEVFVECFKQGGVLARVERERVGGFRPFLYGAVRNVALRFETKRARAREHQVPQGVDLDCLPSDDEGLSRAFDRAWARSLLREAARLQEQRAKELGEDARRRVELLRLRFQEGLPIRDIAGRWQVEPARLHHEYARARQEFKAALMAVVEFHHPGSPQQIEEECGHLLTLVG
jgi:RNA polymerase sigma-70 factor (ECF subfamily)